MGEHQHDEIARLRAELEALRGRTGCCAECERLTLSVDPNQSEPA